MQIEVTTTQCEILLELVEARIRQIHPEIRRSRVYTVRDALKHDLETLEELREQIRTTQTTSTLRGYAADEGLPTNPPPGS